MELFDECGYEQATVADIAARAGLTARTFFRYFADKREILFAGSEELAVGLTAALDTTAPPLDAVASALEVVAELIGGDHELSSRRQTIIAAHPDLQERERGKLAAWSDGLAAELGASGVDALTASLAAETGVGVFRVAFDRWVAGPGDTGLPQTLREAFTQLRAVTEPRR